MNHVHYETYGETEIVAKHRQETVCIPLDDVLYFIADTKYVVMVTMTDEILVTATLKYLMELYGDRFVQVNRNAIVRRSKLGILSSTKGASNYQINVVGTDKIVYVSRRYRGAVLDATERLPEPIPC